MDQLWRRLYIRGAHDDDPLEKLGGYRPGGYHPIHLHDELHHGQYKVIHKLGHGGFSTVWLCRDQNADTPAYVAIKILAASETGKDREGIIPSQLNGDAAKNTPGWQFICQPLKRFESQSPNGTHTCLVYPVLGTTVENAGLIFGEKEHTDSLLREVSRQTVEALAAIHTRGICHADFRPSNILLEMRSLNGLEEEEVHGLLGEPVTTEVFIRKDSRPTPEIPYAPRYLVYPADLDDGNYPCNPPRIKLIDFDVSFDTTHSPHPTAFGIPANYAAPEVVLDTSGGMTMDLWSLGCTLYETRLGSRLFDVFQLGSLSRFEYMGEISDLLGPPPGKWTKFYKTDESDVESDGESDDELDNQPASSPASQTNESTNTGTQRANAIFEKIKGQTDSSGKKHTVGDDEARAMADLLEKLLNYCEHERPTAQDVLQHPWLNL